MPFLRESSGRQRKNEIRILWFETVLQVNFGGLILMRVHLKGSLIIYNRWKLGNAIW